MPTQKNPSTIILSDSTSTLYLPPDLPVEVLEDIIYAERSNQSPFRTLILESPSLALILIVVKELLPHHTFISNIILRDPSQASLDLLAFYRISPRHGNCQIINSPSRHDLLTDPFNTPLQTDSSINNNNNQTLVRDSLYTPPHSVSSTNNNNQTSNQTSIFSPHQIYLELTKASKTFSPHQVYFDLTGASNQGVPSTAHQMNQLYSSAASMPHHQQTPPIPIQSHETTAPRKRETSLPPQPTTSSPINTHPEVRTVPTGLPQPKPVVRDNPMAISNLIDRDTKRKGFVEMPFVKKGDIQFTSTQHSTDRPTKISRTLESHDVADAKTSGYLIDINQSNNLRCIDEVITHIRSNFEKAYKDYCSGELTFTIPTSLKPNFRIVAEMLPAFMKTHFGIETTKNPSDGEKSKKESLQAQHDLIAITISSDQIASLQKVFEKQDQEEMAAMALRDLRNSTAHSH